MSKYAPILKEILDKQYGDVQETTLIAVSSINCQFLTSITQRHFEAYKQLKILIITHCDLRNLDNFPALVQLTDLDLSHNNLQGTFNNLMKLRSLEYLNISNNLVSDVVKLQPLKKLGGITIWIKDNPFVAQTTWKSKLKSYSLTLAKEAKSYATEKKLEEASVKLENGKDSKKEVKEEFKQSIIIKKHSEFIPQHRNHRHERRDGQPLLFRLGNSFDPTNIFRVSSPEYLPRRGVLEPQKAIALTNFIGQRKDQLQSSPDDSEISNNNISRAMSRVAVKNQKLSQKNGQEIEMQIIRNSSSQDQEIDELRQEERISSTNIFRNLNKKKKSPSHSLKARRIIKYSSSDQSDSEKDKNQEEQQNLMNLQKNLSAEDLFPADAYEEERQLFNQNGLLDFAQIFDENGFNQHDHEEEDDEEVGDEGDQVDEVEESDEELEELDESDNEKQ